MYAGHLYMEPFSDLRVLQREDWVVRCLDMASIVVDQLFFPMEHLAWARDVKLLHGRSSPFWHASLLLWAASLIFTILRWGSLDCHFILQNIVILSD